MKTKNISFLFFLVLTFCGESVYPNNNKFVKIQDSLWHYYELANNPKTNNDLLSAFKYYKKHLSISKNINDTDNIISDLHQISIIEYNIGDLFNSENSAVEALKFIDETKDKSYNKRKIGLYNQLGMIYRSLNDYKTALDSYKKASKLTQDQKYLNIIGNNIAFTYKEQGRLEFAEEKFNKVYESSKQFNDSSQLARAMDNLGFIRSKLNMDDGINLMNQALEMRLKLNDLKGSYASYKHLTEYFTSIENFAKAKQFADEAFKVAKNINGRSYIKDAVSNILELRLNKNDVFYIMKDSLDLVDQHLENGYALYKYNYFESELLKEKEKRSKQLYQALGIIFFLGGLITILSLRAKNKRDKILQVYKTETRISKKVHDEVANEIYHAMIKLQDDSNTKYKVLDNLEEIYAKTRDISKENSAIDFKEDFESVLSDLLISYKDEKINVITRNLTKVDWNSISELKKTVLYRVLQELMTNMKKHSKASIVVLSFLKRKNTIIIDYKDDGIGCSVKKKSGLQNVENRIQSINGTITFESEISNGFKATIVV